MRVGGLESVICYIKELFDEFFRMGGMRNFSPAIQIISRTNKPHFEMAHSLSNVVKRKVLTKNSPDFHPGNFNYKNCLCRVLFHFFKNNEY